MDEVQWVGVDEKDGAFFHFATKGRIYHFLAASIEDARSIQPILAEY